jgi:hypothetical protein
MIILALVIPPSFIIYLKEGKNTALEYFGYIGGLGLVIWLEIALFVGLDALADAIFIWSGFPYWATWWIGFLFGFLEIAILIVAIYILIIGVIEN